MNKSAQLFIFLAMIFAGEGAENLYGPAIVSPNPDNLIIAYDLHGVILKTDFQQILNYIRHDLHTWPLLKALPSAFIRFIKFARNGGRVYEVFFEYLFEGSADKDVLTRDFINLMNQQRINQGTVNTIKELKAKGYTLVLASNIGEKTYDALDKNPEMAQVFNLFDNTIIPRPINGYAHKPQSRYYSMLKVSYPGKQIVLIDNSTDKLCGAAHNGISGIAFTTAENLRASLVQEKIL